jgi:hypothetical protein
MRFYVILLPLLLGPLLSQNGFADEWVRRMNSNAQRPLLDAYARATGIPTLSANSGDTLRIWSADVMTAHLLGIIASSGNKLLECRTRYDWREDGVSVKGGHCHATEHHGDLTRALAMLAELATFDGREIDCGVMDGESVYVEGVISGRVFSFYSGNPSLCSDDASKAVTKAREYLLVGGS